MKNDLKVKKMLAALLTLAMLCALSATALAKTDIPEKAAQITGTTVYQNEKASIDASNLAEGYLIVRYTGGKNVKLKVQITKKGGATYTYNLNSAGKAETFPLTEGDGTYTVRVFENISGTKYAQAYSCSVELKLRNEFLPFLYSNQYVNFTAESKTVKKGAELMKDAKDDLDAVRRVYNYVIATLKYDYELAATVKSGYLPDIDAVLEAKKGICFDYAALMSAMLRSGGIPCKLVVGYAGTAYHAWINVYIDGVGWVDKLIYFDGKNWSLMDPTFASSLGAESAALKKYVGDGKNYTAKYAY